MLEPTPQEQDLPAPESHINTPAAPAPENSLLLCASSHLRTITDAHQVLPWALDRQACQALL